jgi:hypothetical protein
MATFLDLPGELRNYIYTLRISLRHKFFSLGEYAIRYPMFLMIADTQIAEEIKSILLAKVGPHLHAEKTYIRRHWADRPSAPTAKRLAKWRFAALPPSIFRTLFRRLKRGLYAPVHAPAHQYVPGSGDGSANKSKFRSTEDWVQPLRSIKKLGFGRFDELVVEVEYLYGLRR